MQELDQLPAPGKDVPQGQERFREWTTYQASLEAFDRSLGKRVRLPDEPPSEQDLQALVKDANAKGRVAGFLEMVSANEITAKSAAIEYAADAESEAIRRSTFKREEYIAIQRVGTYFEGMGNAMEYIRDYMGQHEQIQDLIDTLPAKERPKIDALRVRAKEYMLKLSSLTEERTQFYNARVRIRGFEKQQLPAAELAEKREETVKMFPVLSEPSKKALLESGQAAGNQAHALDEAIILHAAGKKKIVAADGAVKLEDEGFYPQELYLEVLRARYTHLQDQQKGIVRAGTHEGGQIAKEALDRERSATMSQLIALTHEIGSYQISMSELFTSQNLFDRYDVEGAAFSVEGSTPNATFKQQEAEIKKVKEDHLQLLDDMVTTARSSFTPGLFEFGRDLLVDGTFTLNAFQLKVLQFLGGVDFGTGILASRMKNYLSGPMAEAMGWPRDEKTGELKAKLTPEETAKVKEKLGNLQKLMNEFKATAGIEDILSTTKALRALDAATGVGPLNIGHAKEPLPTEARVLTEADIKPTIERYQKELGISKEDAVATLHGVLMTQLTRLWGETNADYSGGTGFMGAYTKMLSSVEKLIDVQLDVAGASFEVSKRFFNVAGGLAIGAGGVLVVTTIGAPVVYKATTTMLRTGGNIVRRAVWGRGPEAAIAPRTGPPTAFQRTAVAGVLAVEAYALYRNIEEYQRDSEQINVTKGRIEKELIDVGFARDPKDADRFVHASGYAVSLKAVYGGVDTQRTVQGARIAANGVTLASTAVTGWIITGSRPLGIAGLVIAGVAITVEGGISEFDKKSARTFLSDPKTPPWLISAIGTSALVKRSQYDLLTNSSSWNVIDSSEEDKQEVRSRMYFAIFNQELGGFMPEVYRELYAGAKNIEAIDTLYATDFKTIILPYIYARLFAKARANGSGVDWKQISEGKVKNSWMVVPPAVSNVDIRSASREAALFYLQHLREQRYLNVATEASLLEKELSLDPGNDAKKAKLADATLLRDMLGREKAFGRPVSNVTDEHVRENAGTRAEKLLAALRKKAVANTLGTPVVTTEIAGMPPELAQAFRFTDEASVRRIYTNDPALLGKLSVIGPLTIDDIEASLDPLWFRQTLKPLIGSLPNTIEGLPYLQRVHAANQVLAALKTPEKLGESESAYAAEMKITEGLVRLMAERRGNTPAFTRVKNNDEVSFMAPGAPAPSRRIGAIASTPDYGAERVIAAFSEQADLGMGQDATLETYVYGDPKQEDGLYVLQRGHATIDIATVNANFLGISSTSIRNEASRKGRSTNYEYAGQPMIMSGADFRKLQPGGAAMLRMAKDAALKLSRERKDDIREQYRKLRIENKPAEMEAHDDARKAPGTWVRLPEYGKSVCYIPDNNSTPGFIYLTAPDMSRQPAISMPGHPDEVAKPGESLVQVTVRDRGFRLSGDYRETLAKMKIDSAPFNYALSTPSSNPRFDIQRLLLVYGVPSVGENLEQMEDQLLRCYSQLKNNDDRRFCLSMLNDLCRKYTRRGKTEEYGSVLTLELVTKVFMDLDLALSQAVSGYKLVVPFKK